MPRIKTPKMSKGHYWWIIEQLPNWFLSAQSFDINYFIDAVCKSLEETNQHFDEVKFTKAALDKMLGDEAIQSFN